MPDPKKAAKKSDAVILINNDFADADRDWAAIVSRVNDDGTLNLHAFSPMGGAPVWFTGVEHQTKYNAAHPLPVWRGLDE